MFRKLFGSKDGDAGDGNAPRPIAPQSNSALQATYPLLFCDDLTLFAPKSGSTPTPWQSVLFSKDLDLVAVRALAEDKNAESRVRLLAHHCLRLHAQNALPQVLLGVVVEVALETGLDVLAAFTDGSVRYIHGSGKIAAFEGRNAALEPTVQRLFAASRDVVSRIGTWDKARLPPPPLGSVRLSFLASDGLHFGQGPMSVMQNDPLAGSVLRAASELLSIVVQSAK
jgi:hypothetical protein